MKFLRLSIQNFLVIQSVDLELAERGLVLVQGVNSVDSSADSNGSGKSSIAEALCWCLYGVTAKGITGDAVVNDRAKKDTMVSVILEDGAERYNVLRYRKHKDHKNALKVVQRDAKGLWTIDLTKGTDKLTQEVVDKIVGASLDVFVSSVYAGQERMPDLPSMTDKELKVLIEEASGSAIMEAAYELARAEHAESSRRVQAAQQKVDTATTSVNWQTAQLADINRRVTDWTMIQSERIREARKEAVAWKTTCDGLKTKWTEMEPELITIAGQLGTVDGQLAALNTPDPEIERLAKLMADTTRLIMGVEVRRSSMRTVLSETRHRLSHAEARVGTPCPDCGRPITESEIGDVKRAAEAQIATLEADIQVVDAEKVALEAEWTRLSAETAARPPRPSTSALVAERDALVTRRHDILKVEQALTQARDEAAKRAAEIRALMAEVCPYEAMRAKATTDLNIAGALLQEAQDELQEVQARHLESAATVAVFAPAGARALILDEVTPYLNAQTERYLSVLSDGHIQATWSTMTPDAKGMLKEKFAIDVSHDLGAKGFKGLSGGERRKVRVATALALQDLVATRATKPIELFIGDEIDDALDAAGLERLMTVLEDKASERGTVMIISHNDLKDNCNNVITVVKEAKGTVLQA